MNVLGLDIPWHGFEDLPLVSRHLTRLELHGVEFHAVQLGSCLLDFSSCPVLDLEHLVLEWCDLSMSAKKISFQSLKYLTMIGPLFISDFRFHIFAPNLVSLCLDNFVGGTTLLESIPSLEEAWVQITVYCEDHCKLWSAYCEGEYCDCEFCDSSDSDNINGDSNNCLLLKGLSEAKKLTLISEPAMVYLRYHLLYLLYNIASTLFPVHCQYHCYRH